jgi:hypothetical protein
LTGHRRPLLLFIGPSHCPKASCGKLLGARSSKSGSHQSPRDDSIAILIKPPGGEAEKLQNSDKKRYNSNNKRNNKSKGRSHCGGNCGRNKTEQSEHDSHNSSGNAIKLPPKPPTLSAPPGSTTAAQSRRRDKGATRRGHRWPPYDYPGLPLAVGRSSQSRPGEPRRARSKTAQFQGACVSTKVRRGASQTIPSPPGAAAPSRKEEAKPERAERWRRGETDVGSQQSVQRVRRRGHPP